MIGRRASQRLWRVPQCQEARLRLTSRKRARERTISPQPIWGGTLRAIRIVVPAASLNVLRTLAFTEAVAFASANEGEPTLVRRHSSRAHPAKPPPRPRGLVQCFLNGRCPMCVDRLASSRYAATPACRRSRHAQSIPTAAIAEDCRARTNRLRRFHDRSVSIRRPRIRR
jgi:hypothetical protein